MSASIPSRLAQRLSDHIIANEDNTRDLNDYRLLHLLAKFAESYYPVWSKRNRATEYNSILRDVQQKIGLRWASDNAAPLTERPKVKRSRHYDNWLNCEHCGGSFQSSRVDARFCSQKCRAAKLKAQKEFESAVFSLTMGLRGFLNQYEKSDHDVAPTMKELASLLASFENRQDYIRPITVKPVSERN